MFGKFQVASGASLSLFSALLLGVFSPARAEQPDPSYGPTVVQAPVSRMYVPLGFDDNDNVEVILHGVFKNACYKTNDTKAKVDKEKKRILISATSLQYEDSICLQMLVPFIQEVKLGSLPPGEYAIEYVGTSGVEPQKLVVARHLSNSPDDYLYAPVRQASLIRNSPDGKHVLRLTGTFPRMFIGCMVMQEIRTQVTPGNVLVVQPIGRIADDSECTESKYSFDFVSDVKVSNDLESELLVHVRVLNGESINVHYEQLP